MRVKNPIQETALTTVGTKLETNLFENPAKLFFFGYWTTYWRGDAKNLKKQTAPIQHDGGTKLETNLLENPAKPYFFYVFLATGQYIGGVTRKT